MKLLSISLALIASVSALAVPDQDIGPSNIDVGIKFAEHVPLDTPTENNNVTVVKRDSGLEKRQTIVVDVYFDNNYQGRHEGLFTDINKCYSLGNGWNDQISSLKVPSGYGCYFYRNTGCDSNDNWLRVTNPLNLPDLRVYDFNDKASSYLCYR
jgi:hypothetical protein